MVSIPGDEAADSLAEGGREDFLEDQEGQGIEELSGAEAVLNEWIFSGGGVLF